MAAALGVICIGTWVAMTLLMPAPSVAEPESSVKWNPLSVPATNPAARLGGADVTFLWASGVHVGGSGLLANREWEPIEPLLVSMIDQMNAVAGRAYPPRVGGDVAEPAGLVISGDITEDGKVDQWRDFVALFGLTGTEGRLQYPVYEGIGNHDRRGRRYVADQVASRHGSNRYSWQWDDLHMIGLGEAPDDDGLDWLAADLAGVGPDRPVIVYLHYSLAGPFSGSHWFGKGDYGERMAEILRGYNVIGIFHGHFHGSGAYRWRGFDVYNIGSAKHYDKTFAVVRVTDSSLTVAAWDFDARRWAWAYRKPINGATADDVEPVGVYGSAGNGGADKPRLTGVIR